MDKKALPEGWRWASIGDVVREAQSGFACGERDINGVIQLRMNNVNTNGAFNWSGLTRVPQQIDNLDKFQLLPGDIVFNNTNSTELVGKSAYFSGYEEQVVYSNHFTRLRVYESECESVYLSFWLNNLWSQKVFEEICNRWIGQSAVKPDKLLSLDIPLPPLTDQKRIAAVLTERLAAVERARKASEARLQAARALPAAYLREVFESEEARGWDVAQLGELVSSSLRTGISKPEKPDSGKKCLTLSAVKSGVLLLDQVKSVDVTDAEAKRNEIRAGAFYVVRGNGNKSLVGRGGIAPNQCSGVIFPDLLFEIIPNPNILSIDFLRWAWDSQSVRSQIEEKAKTAAGIYKINQQNLASIELPIPPLLLQKQVATVLSNKISKVTCIQKMIFDELVAVGTMSASYLRQAFSGTL